jgi:hypothetical protein
MWGRSRAALGLDSRGRLSLRKPDGPEARHHMNKAGLSGGKRAAYRSGEAVITCNAEFFRSCQDSAMEKNTMRHDVASGIYNRGGNQSIKSTQESLRCPT